MNITRAALTAAIEASIAADGSLTDDEIARLRHVSATAPRTAVGAFRLPSGVGCPLALADVDGCGREPFWQEFDSQLLAGGISPVLEVID